MPEPQTNHSLDATIRIYGKVQAADFPAWIARHARKLGLIGVTTLQASDCVIVQATGAQDMLGALALGCSLGPASVLVERVDYAPEPRQSCARSLTKIAPYV
jgi:acylphosphatase